MKRNNSARYISIIILMSFCAFLFFFCFLDKKTIFAADNRSKVFVLCYHSFLGRKNFYGDVSLLDLKNQMDFFISKGFKFVTFSELTKDIVKGKRNILIVIDDGNDSVYKAYNDVFKPLHIKPVLAIYPSIIGKKSYALTWDKLKELSKEGCDIAAHGYYHQLLNQELYDKDKTAFNREIFFSKHVLEKNLNTKVELFVYPNGVRSEIAKRTLKDAGFQYAFNIVWGPLLSPLELNKDRYDLPRYMLYHDNWAMISNSVIRASDR